MSNVIQYLSRIVLSFVMILLLPSCTTLPPDKEPDTSSVILTLRIPTQTNNSGSGVPVLGSVDWTHAADDDSLLIPTSDASGFNPMNIGPDAQGNAMWVVDVVSQEVSYADAPPGFLADATQYGVEMDGFTAVCTVNINPGLNRFNFTHGESSCGIGAGNFP